MIFVINLSSCFISRFRRFHEDFTLHAFHSLYTFHLPIPFTSLSLSPLYPFHLSIPFTSLSSLSLSYLSLTLFISPSTFLSLSLLLSLFSLSFSLAYLMDVFVLVSSANYPKWVFRIIIVKLNNLVRFPRRNITILLLLINVYISN